MKRLKKTEKTELRKEYLEFVQIAIENKLIPPKSSGHEPDTKHIVATLKNITSQIREGLNSKDNSRRNQLINPFLVIASTEPKETDHPTKVLAITIARIALTLNNTSYKNQEVE